MKTLKDIEVVIPDRNGDYSLINSDRLRQAVRELIKDYETKGENEESPILKCVYQQIANEFCHFFNLEGEE